MTTELSLNGVPYRDTMRFLREVHDVVENDFNNVFALLTEFVELENDTTVHDDRPMFEAIRIPSFDYHSRLEKRLLKKTKLNGRHISKRKEVK